MHWSLTIIVNWFAVLSVIANSFQYAICYHQRSRNQNGKLWFLIQSRPKSAPTTPSEWRERAIWSLKSGLSSPHFGVDPPVHPTFWKGCRRSTSTNDPANERARACHKAPSFKNIGLGGVPASNQALNSTESVCIPVLYISILRTSPFRRRGCQPLDRNAASPRLEPGPQGHSGRRSRPGQTFTKSEIWTKS